MIADCDVPDCTIDGPHHHGEGPWVWGAIVFTDFYGTVRRAEGMSLGDVRRMATTPYLGDTHGQ